MTESGSLAPGAKRRFDGTERYSLIDELEASPVQQPGAQRWGTCPIRSTIPEVRYVAPDHAVPGLT
jgi:hypothetical protein